MKCGCAALADAALPTANTTCSALGSTRGLCGDRMRLTAGVIIYGEEETEERKEEERK